MAKDILVGWKSSKRRKQALEQTKTFTSKRSSNKVQSTPLDFNCTRTSNDSSEEKRISSISYNDIKQDIVNCEKSIKEYESKMETCSNNVLLNYYITSCHSLREHIRSLL